MLNSFFTWIKTYTPFPASTTPFQRFPRPKKVAAPAAGDTPLPWAQEKTVHEASGEPKDQSTDNEGLVFDLSDPAPAAAPQPSAKLQRRSTKQSQNVEEGETI